MSEAAFGRSTAAEPVFSDWLLAEMRENRVIYIFLCVFLASSLLVSALRGDESLPTIVVYLEQMLRALAWHYRVDGIVGAIAAFAVWYVAGLASRSRLEKAIR